MPHYRSVMIVANAFEAVREGKENIKVEVCTFYEGTVLGTFFVPVTSYCDRRGKCGFAKILKDRIKHDFKITFDHYSSMGW